ncbi:MAG: hypothetical protein IPN14_17100 [Bacteroidetes bacterium]|nr:hypothetical protein [Bacteroidota bacterium]
MEAAYKTKLPNLSEIEIYIVNKRNKGNDAAIEKAQEFWKDLFLNENRAKIFKESGNLNID